MKLRKILISLLMSIVMLIGSVPAFDLTAQASSMPYAIAVDLTNQIVTIYSTSDWSIVRQMLCSTGLNGATPTGTFTLPKKKRSTERTEWYYFSMYGSYARYATRVYKGIMFHSIPCNAQSDASISKKAIAEFGQPASHGCIRLRWQDAKFIAEQCAVGTKCKIYKSGKRDEDLRSMLMESSYTQESGMTYNEFLGIPDEPGVLGRYSEGSEVKDLQYRLRALGFYNDSITGQYGGTTVNAVKQLQAELGLEQNGAATLSLQELVYSADAPTAMYVTLSEGMSGPAVRKLQENLSVLRLYDGEMDSIYDVDVVNSVTLFQQVYGYTADGVASSEVQQAIHYEAGLLNALFALTPDYTCEILTEELKTVQVVSTVNIRIRSKPSTSSEALGRVSNGTYLLLLEAQGDWAKVQYRTNVGFIMSTYLEPVKSQSTSLQYASADGSQTHAIGHTATEYLSGAEFPVSAFQDRLASEASLDDYEGVAVYATVATNDDTLKLNLREDPSVNSNILAQLENGTQLNVLLQSSEWTLVSHDGVSGYLLNEYLEFWNGPEGALNPDAPGEEEPTAEEEPYETETLYALVQCAEGDAMVYDLDSDDANQIGHLPHGTRLTVIESDDDWSLIDWEGHQGYMRNENLQFVLTEDDF